MAGNWVDRKAAKLVSTKVASKASLMVDSLAGRKDSSDSKSVDPSAVESSLDGSWAVSKVGLKDVAQAATKVVWMAAWTALMKVALKVVPKGLWSAAWKASMMAASKVDSKELN